MKIIGGMDGSPSPCSRMFGTRLALQQGLGHSSAAGLLQLTQSLRLVALFITGNFQVREKCLRNESPLILYTYITIYIYYSIYIYTSGDENITQWPSGDLFPQPAPFSTASGPCLAFEAHSSHSLHRSLQDRCQAFHQSLQALLQTSSVINLSIMDYPHRPMDYQWIPH